MADTIYAEGIRVFAPREGAPDFVKGQMIIGLNELIEFCKKNPDYLSEYNGKKQLKLNLLEGNKGLYTTVDTFKPTTREQQPAQSFTNNDVKNDDFPFD